MIMTRTPFRISFFGGGTDYPVWYKEYSGAVLAGTINKYCYITCRYMPPFWKERFRVIYSQIEAVKNIPDIRHPSVRACLSYMNIKQGMVIHHDADLPARSGLGSSSAFTVGLLNALYATKGRMPTKRQLALSAIHIEQELLRENVGSQDQALAAFGGLNLVEFGGKEQFQIRPVTIATQRLEALQSHLMLFFTGFSRIASKVAREQIRKTPYKKRELRAMLEILNSALGVLNSNADLAGFGRLLNESWKIKRSLSNRISSPQIDQIYSAALSAGALGGKLLGAGGGGFMLIFAKPEAQEKVRKRLKRLLCVPFRFESLGSQIIFYSTYDNLGIA